MRAECDVVVFCLPGRFLSCLAAVISTRGIMKSTCNCLLSSIASSVFKVGLGGAFGSVGSASGRLTGSCLRASARSAHNRGIFGIRGRYMPGSAVKGRDLSARVA